MIKVLDKKHMDLINCCNLTVKQKCCQIVSFRLFICCKFPTLKTLKMRISKFESVWILIAEPTSLYNSFHICRSKKTVET